MAGRAMKRGNPLIPPYENWMAVEDARGQWRVMIERLRLDPLCNPDPVERMLAVHLAAEAPAMRAFCQAVVPRLFSSRWVNIDRRYRHIADFGTGFLYCGPSTFAMARTLPMAGVLELPLDSRRDTRAA
jgi:hypothetical protein